MSLVTAYTQHLRKPFDRIIVSGPDAHGVSLAAGRLRILQQGENVLVYSKFPDTLPRNAAQTFAKIAEQYEAIKGTEVLDIPVNVQAPSAFIEAASRLPAPVVLYDHHETSAPFAQEMIRKGIIPVIAGDGLQLATVLGLLQDEEARRIAEVGIVADRDKSILKLESREKVEKELMPQANVLDVIVRQPQLVDCQDQGCVAKKLALHGISLINTISVDYPPYRIANEVKILDEGEYAVLLDFTSLDPAISMWIPKTIETILIRRNKDIAVAIAPAYNPRTKTLEGYDVRVIKYWLSDFPASAEELVKDVIQQLAIQGRVVGHADYVSMRFGSIEEATRVAREVFHRAEAQESYTAHLINDQLVARAVRHEYREIIKLLERIARALERGASAKEEQVEMLRELYRRDERTRYD